MFAAIRKVLQEVCHFEPRDLLVVAVSGGPDSLALMTLLHEMDWNMIVAHLNHQLRPSADLEEEGVRQWALQMGAVFASRRVNVKEYAQEHALSIEEAARHCRYRFLFEQAQQYQARAVLVAHTADDQVETILMRLMRGTGREGLRGMSVVSFPNQWSSTIPLVRPLLSVWRVQIMEYLQDKGLTPFTDESNLDNTYTRNRIRNTLIPYLETFNPTIRKLLWQTAQILGDEEEVLRTQEESAWHDAVNDCSAEMIGFDLLKFKSYPQALRRRIVRRAWKELYGDLVDLEFLQVEKVIDTFLAKRVGKHHISANLLCLITSEMGYLVKGKETLPTLGFPQLGTQGVLSVPYTGFVRLNEQWVLKVERVSDQPYLAMQQSKENRLEAWLDSDSCKGKLFVRTPRRGDRFAPLSMQGRSAKLSDIFINRKIPVWVRKAYPLICSETDILWIPGYTISHFAQLTPKSQEAFHLTIIEDSVVADC